jgi:hypothetical protein
LINFGYSDKKQKIQMTREIIIPDNSFFATYEYSANMNLNFENMISISGDGDFETMRFYFNHKKVEHNFTIPTESYYLDL